MSIANWSERDQAGLAAFYATGNDWDWEQMRSGASAGARSVSDWLEQSPVPGAHPVILPRVQSSGSSILVRWYAVAFSEAQAEELREQLNAFLGPVMSDYAGVRTILDPGDPAEVALAKWVAGPWVYRFEVAADGRAAIRQALRRLQQIWRLQPPLRDFLPRSTEALLSEFFAALRNGNDGTAQRRLEELQDGGRLSAENLTFLHIERLAALGRWHDIAQFPQLSLLLLVRRPRYITALLIEALWRTEFASFVENSDGEGAVARFRTEFASRYQPLLRARGDLANAPVVLTFLLAAVASEPPRREQIPLLLNLLEGQERSFGEALAGLVPTPIVRVPAPASPLALANQAFHAGDYDTTWTHLQKVQITVKSCRLLIDCAVEIDTANAARVVRKALDALTPRDRDEIFLIKRHRRAWEDLQKLDEPAADLPPQDWESWFARADADPKWPRLLPIAHDAAFRWPLTEYLHAPARVAALADLLLASHPPEAETVIRLAIPHLLNFFIPEGKGVAAFRSFYQSALMVLGVSEDFGSENWATAQTLLLAIMDAGVNGEAYEETVLTLCELWNRFGSPQRLDWALDTLDILASEPAPNTMARDAFFMAIRSSMARDYRRIRPQHWDIFRWLAIDLGHEADYQSLRPEGILFQGDAVAESVNLEGCVIGIYTLTTSAGARAKSVIEALFPGVDVRLNHDHVGSERLKSLAREAEYFIVASRSAKHAATEFIKENRPPSLSDLIYPAGKGSSSIVSALRNMIEIG